MIPTLPTLPYFDRPLLLVLAAVLPVVVVALFVAAYRRRRARLARLGQPQVVARLVPPTALRTPRRRALLLGGAALAAGLAAAGPRWGTERTVVRGEGIDLVLALDASLSMLATDVRPDRLTRMKQEVRRLLSLMGGDRVGLIAFAGRSYILTPLTIDAGAIDLYLDNLEPSVVGQAGSSLARAIRQGTALLRSTTSEADKALVVMSDGEAFEPVADVVEAARGAAEAGIALVTVGFGTPGGAQIPVREGDDVVPKRDQTGNVVVSRYSPDMLRAAAEAAGGTFIAAEETDKAARVRRALAQLRTAQRAAVAGRERRPRFQLFLIPALLLLIADTLLAERRGRRRPAPAAASTPAAAAALAGALVLAGCGRPLPFARGDEAAAAYRAGRYAQAAAMYRQAIADGDRGPVALYNLGTALVAADSLERAAQVLEPVSTARDEELRYRALFNLGLAHLKRGLALEGEAAQPPLDAALAAYKRVLLMRSADGDAKWNYELALRRKQSGGGGGGGGGGGPSQSETPEPQPQREQPQPRPAGGLGQQRAEQLLNSAAREERDVQARKQQQNQPTPPPGGKDW